MGLENIHRFHTKDTLKEYRSAVRSLSEQEYTVESFRDEVDDHVYCELLENSVRLDDTVFLWADDVESVRTRLFQAYRARDAYEELENNGYDNGNLFYRHGYGSVDEQCYAAAELEDRLHDTSSNIISSARGGHALGLVGAVGTTGLAALTHIEELALGSIAAFALGAGSGFAASSYHTGKKHRLEEAFDTALHAEYQMQPSKEEFIVEQVIDQAGDCELRIA